MISGIPHTRDPWVLYYWFVNELRITGYDEDFILSVLAKPPHVPRETPCVCENIQSGGRVEVDFNQKCIKCGKQFNFVLAKTKTKHKEVFENVKWDAYPSATKSNCLTVSTSFDATKGGTKGMSFANKPPMKMTLEWEE